MSLMYFHVAGKDIDLHKFQMLIFQFRKSFSLLMNFITSLVHRARHH